MTTTAKHQILIVGGGTAGITVAARMLRKGYTDVAVIEPSSTHYYQPLWTLVGGGQAKASTTERAESSVMPKRRDLDQERRQRPFDPDNNTVTCADGATYDYDVLVVCPGIQLDWNRTEGLEDALGRDGVSSNYRFDLAPRTWDFIRNTRSGTAVFTVPSGPIKCAGAPQKIAYLAADYWRKQGVLNDIDVHLVVPSAAAVRHPGDRRQPRYGHRRLRHHRAHQLRGDLHRRGGAQGHGHQRRRRAGPTPCCPTTCCTPYRASRRRTGSSPARCRPATPNGYVDIDKHTMQHVRYPNVFSLGDAGSSPNSKTGAAIRKQAPVVVDNIDAFLNGQPLRAAYNGYGSCPIVTSSHAMLLAEFDYDLHLTPSIPAARPDEAAPRVLVPQEVRPAVHVLEPDAQGPRLAIRLRHNERTSQWQQGI